MKSQLEKSAPREQKNLALITPITTFLCDVDEKKKKLGRRCFHLMGIRRQRVTIGVNVREEIPFFCVLTKCFSLFFFSFLIIKRILTVRDSVTSYERTKVWKISIFRKEKEWPYKPLNSLYYCLLSKANPQVMSDNTVSNRIIFRTRLRLRTLYLFSEKLR